MSENINESTIRPYLDSVATIIKKIEKRLGVIHENISHENTSSSVPPDSTKNFQNNISVEVADLKSSLLSVSSSQENLQKKLSKLDKTTTKIINDNKLTYMTKNGVWFYTQMKSGTTYTINFLINYLNLLNDFNSGPVDSKKISLFHSTHQSVTRTPEEEILFKQGEVLALTNLSSFVHTHHKIISNSKKTILMTRNPLDYIVSKYFYMHKNRDSKKSINELWMALANEFIKTYRDHSHIAHVEKESVLLVKYEDLILSPDLTFKTIIGYLGVEYDHKTLEKALAYSSKESVKKMESKRGRALVAGKNFKGESFVRSGKIGDWKNHIDEKLEKEIREYLELNGINLKDFVYV